jgi:hypothetical protein
MEIHDAQTKAFALDMSGGTRQTLTAQEAEYFQCVQASRNDAAEIIARMNQPAWSSLAVISIACPPLGIVAITGHCLSKLFGKKARPFNVPPPLPPAEPAFFSAAGFGFRSQK